MFLQSLRLSNYRNYETIDFSTDRLINIIMGPNAQGKTNLLEAIYVMALTKSHRTHQDKELIRWNSKCASIHIEIEKKYGLTKLDLQISQQGKKAKINGLEQKKLSLFIGSFNVVMFAPEDLQMVKGSPNVRRRFLDMEIAQMNPSYLYDMTQYQKILNQRNQLLKQQSNMKEPVLAVWNEQLATYGTKIMKKRQSFINKLQEWAAQIHESITNQSEKLRIVYEPSFPCNEKIEETILFNHFMLKLSQAKEQELRRGVTLVGPHRDDMLFYINNKEAQTYGSQGQQRTVALSIKLAEIELIRQETGEYPILLLDDVLSELDASRQTHLLQTFQKKVQTFITTASLESVNVNNLEQPAIFKVTEGCIYRG